MNRLYVVLLCLICTCATAQVPPRDLTQKFRDFRKKLPLSRLHFVFSQDKYAAGDTVFFKGYFLNENNEPVPGRQLIDLNLVSSQTVVAAHLLVAIENGIGAGQLVLPGTLTPGIYLMTAHSTYMKNFEIPPTFSKEITVVGEKKVVRNASNTDLAQLKVEGSAVSISIPEESLLRYQRMNLIVTNKNEITFAKSFFLGTKTFISIATGDSFKPGINVVSVVDPLWSTVAAITVYIPEKNPVKAVIENKDALSARKNTTLVISILDEHNQPVKGEFSISVLNAVARGNDSLSFQRQMAASSPKVESWRQILAGRTAQRYNYKTDLLRNGKVFLNDGSPAKDGTRVFFYFQENDILSQVVTQANGRIRLAIPDIKYNDELFYIAEYAGEEIADIRVEWERADIPLLSPPPSIELDEEDPYGIFAASKKMIDKAFGYNEMNAQVIADGIERKHSELVNRIVSGPDATIEIDDYVLFPTMQEMIKEVISSLHLRKVKGVTVASLGLQEGMSIGEPLYIIDGVVTKNTGYFLSLNPADLVSIKLVTNPRKLAPIGQLGKGGVVIVESKTGVLRLPADPSRQIEAISRALPFRLPTTTDVRKPDFRSTIYWNPIVRTDGNGKAVVEFRSSDDLGKVVVRVKGMTVDGRAFSGEIELLQGL